MESVALISREASAHEAAECIGAMRKDVTWSVLALIFICVAEKKQQVCFTITLIYIIKDGFDA